MRRTRLIVIDDVRFQAKDSTTCRTERTLSILGIRDAGAGG